VVSKKSQFLAPGFESDRVPIFLIRRVTGGPVGDQNLDVGALTTPGNLELHQPLFGAGQAGGWRAPHDNQGSEISESPDVDRLLQVVRDRFVAGGAGTVGVSAVAGETYLCRYLP
jgi:hypothetical protein